MSLFRKGCVQKKSESLIRAALLFLMLTLLSLIASVSAFADTEASNSAAKQYEGLALSEGSMGESHTLDKEQAGKGPVLSKTATQVGDGLWQIKLEVTTENPDTPAVADLDIAIVLDVSGSMDTLVPVSGSVEGEKKPRLAMAKEAAASLVQSLVDDPPVSGKVRISLITFSKDAKTILPLEDIGDGTKCIGMINSLATESSTYINKGLDQAKFELFKNPETSCADSIKYTILLGDGDPTGDTGPSTEHAATALKEAGSKLICISMFEKVDLLLSIQDAGYYQCSDEQGFLQAMSDIQETIGSAGLTSARVVDPMGDDFVLASQTGSLDNALGNIEFEGCPDGGYIDIVPGSPQVLNWELSPSSTRASLTYYVKMKDTCQVNTACKTNGRAYLSYTDASHATPVEIDFPVPEVIYEASILHVGCSGIDSSSAPCKKDYKQPVFGNNRIEFEGPEELAGYELEQLLYTVQGKSISYSCWADFYVDQNINEASSPHTYFLAADFAEERELTYVYKKAVKQPSPPAIGTSPKDNGTVHEDSESQRESENAPVLVQEAAPEQEDTKKDDVRKDLDSIRIVVTGIRQPVAENQMQKDTLKNTPKEGGASLGFHQGGTASDDPKDGEASHTSTDKTWSLINLIVAAIAGLVAIRCLVKALGLKRKENPPQDERDVEEDFLALIEEPSSDRYAKPSWRTRIVGLVASALGLMPLLAFFLLEDLSLPLVFDVNVHTVPIAFLTALFIVSLAVYVYAGTRDAKKRSSKTGN